MEVLYTQVYAARESVYYRTVTVYFQQPFTLKVLSSEMDPAEIRLIR
jgi:hypothetical protein